MAVLKFQPTVAPDFSSTSDILRNAGLAQDRAFDSASDLLSSYQAGRSERADNEVFAEIAKLKTQEQIDAYFDGDGIRGRPISVAARDRLGKLRSNRANLNQVQQQTSASLASQTRQDAVEKRLATNDQDRLTTQRIAREQGPDAARAWIEAQTFGTTGVLGATPPPPVAGVDPIAAAVAGSPGPSAAPAPVSGVLTVGGGSRAPAHLVVNESGGNFQATNESVGSGGIKGHDGRVQASAKRITDAKNAGILPKGMTREEFRNDPKAQISFENWHFDDIDNNIQKSGYSKYIGTTINGVEVTHQGMVDVQHLGGATGLKKFLESNGSADPKDDNGTSLTDYLRAGGEATTSGPIDSQPLDPIAVAAAEKPPIFATGPLTGSTEEQANEATRRIQAEIAVTDPVTGFGGSAPAPLGPNQGGRPVVPLEVLQREVDKQEATSVEAAIEAAVNPPKTTEIQTNVRVARDARIAQILARPDLTGDQMIAKLANLRAATSQGEATNLAKAAVKRRENLTRIATKWADDPNSSMKLEELQRLLADEPGTAVEKAAAGLFALEIGNGALAYRVKPSYIKDPSVERGIATEKARNRKTLEIQRIHQIMNTAKLFGNEDPSTALENLVKSQNDGEAQTPYWFGIGADATAANSVRKLVAFIANEAGVTPAIAAAAMAERFTPNPQGFFDGFNTNENRFDKTGAISWLKDNASEDALRIYQGDVERVARREDELNAGGLTLSIMQHRLKKMNDSNSTPQEQKDAKKAITSLQSTLKAGRTPIEGAEALSDYVGIDGMGIAIYLKTLEPGSESHKRATDFIKLTIEGDDSISSAHKRLLLAAINS